MHRTRADRLLIALLWMLALLFTVLVVVFLRAEGMASARGDPYRYLMPATLLLAYLLLVLTYAMHRRTRRRAALEETILESAGVVSYRYSTTRGGLDYSDGVKRLLGWSRAELVADPQRWMRAIHPDDAQRVGPRAIEPLSGGLYAVEYRIRNADGEWRWVFDRAIHVEPGDGEMLIDGVAIDVTLEHALRERVEDEGARLRNVLDAIPDIVFLKDLDSRYQMVNRAFADYLGRSNAEIVGRDDADLFPADRAETVRKADRTVIAQNVPLRETQHWLLGARGAVSLDVIRQPLRDANGKVVGVVGIARDVTAQEAGERERQRLVEELAGGRIARAREEVAGAEDRARRVMQALGDAVVGMDSRGVAMFANAAAESLFGYSEAQFLGQSVHLLTHHTRADGSACPAHDCPIMLAARRSEDRVARGTDLFWRHDGSAFTGEYSLLPVWREGKPDGTVFVVRDVTEREAIAQRLEMLSRAVEDSPAGVSVTDLAGRILYVNRRFCEMTGYAEDELLGATHALLRSGTMTEEFYGDLWRTITDGREWVGDIHNRRKDGEYFWSHTLITPLKGEHGRNLRYLAIREDITRQRQLEARERDAREAADAAQREIVAQERRLRALTDGVPAMIIFFDRDHRLVYCNRQYAEYFGFDRETAKGRTLLELLGAAIFDETRPYRDAALAGTEARYQSGRGDQVIDVTMTPARDEHGAIIGVYTLVIDITDERRKENELAAARDAAEAANEAKSQFLANVSHEIRTPMNAILGLSELVLRTPLDTQQRGYLEKAQRSARLLLGLLNDVLDLSRIEAGRLELDPRPFRIDDVLEQVAELFGDSAAEKGLEFVIDAPPDLPAEFTIDSLRLTQVLTNLLSNAIKFTSHGEVALEIGFRVADGEDPPKLTIAVRDTGIGMTEDQVRRVFDPFTQADGSTSRRYGGTGLGLSISRDLVRLLGGRLAVESEPGRGSRFHFEIPAPFGAPPPPEQAARGQAVLLWIAHAGARAAVERQLQGLGYVPVSCTGSAQVIALGREAEAAGRVRPPLVADEVVGGQAELLEWLARHASRAGTPALVLLHRGMQARMSSLPPVELVARPATRRRLHEALLVVRGLARHAEHRESLARPGLSQAKVLVVDDYPLNVEIVSTFLAEAGCEVVTAHDGAEALQRLAEGPVDVVLMDCQMPVMDGFAATRAIRREPRWRELPVLAMTANVTEHDRRACLDSGMNDFIPKPVMIGQLLDVIARHVGGRGVATPAAEASAPALAEPATAPDEAGREAFAALHGIDLDSALASTMGKPDFLRKVLGIFVATQGEFAAKFSAARAAGDAATATRAAHTLKGSAASIGALALREAALALEAASKSAADDEVVGQALAAVVAELDPVLAGIRATLDA